MPLSSYHTPGIYVEEVPSGSHVITAVPTSIAAFVGQVPFADAPALAPEAINNWTEFKTRFIDPVDPDKRESNVLANAVYGFFLNQGSRCWVVNTGGDTSITAALATLEAVDEIAIVAAPGLSDVAAHKALLAHCENLKDRVAVLDPPPEVDDIELLTQSETVEVPAGGGRKKADPDAPAGGGLWPGPSDKGFGAFYHPWILVEDVIVPPAQVAAPPSGHVAGVWARTDATRGVHKAPANEVISGALNLMSPVTRGDNGVLNDAGRQLHPQLRPRGHPRVGGAHDRRPGQRVALPQRAAAVQHDRGVDRGGHELDRLRAQRPHAVEAHPPRRRRVPHRGLA